MNLLTKFPLFLKTSVSRSKRARTAIKVLETKKKSPLNNIFKKINANTIAIMTTTNLRTFTKPHTMTTISTATTNSKTIGGNKTNIITTGSPSVTTRIKGIMISIMKIRGTMMYRRISMRKRMSGKAGRTIKMMGSPIKFKEFSTFRGNLFTR